MFLDFFLLLKEKGLPVSLREYLDLLAALEANVPEYNVEHFYFLSRTILVKNEEHLDVFDQVFSVYFKGKEQIPSSNILNLPEDWLRKNGERLFSREELEKIKSQGDLESLLDRMAELLKEQKERHAGGNEWIGTGGTSPFGANGYNPEGFRIGQKDGRQGRAVKVWEKREFKDLDDSITLGIRNIKVALRRLRKFARQGAADQLDMDDTIRSTARNAGYLDLKMVPERHNAVKVLIFFDVGGSMDPHIRVCEELFSAARLEFKHMEYFYFHNFVYESVWKNNIRRMNETSSTWDILHKYTPDYKVI